MRLMDAIWFLQKQGIKVRSHKAMDRGMLYRIDFPDDSTVMIAAATTVCEVAQSYKE